MANRIDTNNDGKRDKLNRQDAAAAISYISETLTSARSQPKYIDELIVSLSNAHENRRARQVTEWEQMRRHRIHHTA